MAKYTIFVDGAEGTTGLRIHQRLEKQDEILLLQLPHGKRKDLDSRLHAVQQADLSVLCLPDSAAKELVDAAPANSKICDTSTAHRTSPGWVYGFAELGGQKDAMRSANRVAVPGCHATGFLALVAPLVQCGALPNSAQLTANSITGYSGGGKSMIAAYEDENRPQEYAAPRLYGLTMQHKHLPEMTKIAGLEKPPLFMPVVADYYNGMLVSIAVPAKVFNKGWQTPAAITQALQTYYNGKPLITVFPCNYSPPAGVLAANALANKDNMELYVLGNQETILLTARFDNLGKGACGAAMQCINIMLGRPETTGLTF